MNNKPIVIRTNRNSKFILEAIVLAILIILLFSIYESVRFKHVDFNIFNIPILIGIWCVLMWLEIRRFKTILLYEDYVIIRSKSGDEEKIDITKLYLNIVNHPSKSLRSNRTLQLRKKGTHKKVFSIEPHDWEDDLFLEDKLRNVCKIKVDNWVE